MTDTRVVGAATTKALHLPALDGLRGTAALMILVVHGGMLAMHAGTGAEAEALNSSVQTWGLMRTGVQLFYVLSGFLLFLPYAMAISGQRSWPNRRNFYARRLRRVGPAYWIALAILSVATMAAWWDVLLHVAFVHNFSHTTYKSINDVFWSMAVEVQFYAVLPLLALLVRRFGPRMLLVLVCVSPATAACLLVVGRLFPASEHYFPAVALLTYLGVFAAGMGAAWFFVTGQVTASRARTLGALGAGLLALHVAKAALGFAGTKVDVLLLDVTFGLAYAGVLLAAVAGDGGTRRVFEGRILGWFGLISYSLYIWHSAIYRLFDESRFPAGLSTVTTVGIAIGIAVPVAWLSYMLTERPFLAKATAQRTV